MFEMENDRLLLKHDGTESQNQDKMGRGIHASVPILQGIYAPSPYPSPSGVEVLAYSKDKLPGGEGGYNVLLPK